MDNVGRAGTGYARVNGTSFYYERAGSGDPLVLVHAGVADHRMWEGQIAPLAKHFTVVRYDARGYGKTGRGEGSYTWVQDLHELLRALDLGRVIMVGCSAGGTTALDFALAFPDAVRALVLVSATPSGYQFEGQPPARLLKFFGAYQQGDLDRAAELAAQVWFDGPGRGPEQTDRALRDHARRLLRDVLASGSLDLGAANGTEPPAVDRLTEVRVPTLVVTGGNDDPGVIAAGDYMAARIPRAARARIVDAGHLAPIEQAEEFNRMLLGFLGEPELPVKSNG